MLAKWQKAAPNLTPENIIATSMEDPEEIEIRFPQMRRGSIKHGDYSPLQMGCFRPNQECSGSETPIEGLYVCGVSDLPRRARARRLRATWAPTRWPRTSASKKWWKPTSEMERYIKTYLQE